MKKRMVLFISVAVSLFFAGQAVLHAQTFQKQHHAKKKSGKSRIVVEYIAFPEKLKQFDVYPWETLKVEDFRSAYAKMTGQGALEGWVRSLTGTATNRNRMIAAFKERFLLIVSCKPHMCDESQLIILYDPSGRKAFGILAKAGKFRWFGDPPGKMKDLLNILLVEEFKEIYKAGK